MNTSWSTTFKNALHLTILLTILTGLLYPLTVTLFAQLLFPYQANGSLISGKQGFIGSHWLGQSFTLPHYFWGRPSCTMPIPYNSMNSSSCTTYIASPSYQAQLRERVHQLQPALNKDIPIPIDLITASASGLDPDISVEAALYQIPRVSKATHLTPQQLEQLVIDHQIYPLFGFLGEARVNVLLLNLALDDLRISHARSS